MMVGHLLLSLLAVQVDTLPDWSFDDSARVAFAEQFGRAYRKEGLVLWVPRDSLDAAWVAAFADSLAQGVATLRSLVGGPHPWQRLRTRPVEFYVSSDRFVSHASGRGAVFLSLRSVRQGYSPFLHEAAHELLAAGFPFFPFEHGDSLAWVRAAENFPFWLSEGLADYLAQAAALSSGFREGDVFSIGGLKKSDSTCAARLSASPRREEIESKVGDQGRIEALFTEERGQVAPAYYACSQSFARHLVERIGLEATVGLFPQIASGQWLSQLHTAAGVPLEAIRREWMKKIAGLERYVFYLHGRIVEEQGRRPTDPAFGVYEYDAILDSLRQAGFAVLSEQRPAGIPADTFAARLVRQVDSLIGRGVAPENVTVIGFSRGGAIAILASARLQNPAISFVFMGACGSWAFDRRDIRLAGRILSLYETSDTLGVSCEPLFQRKATGTVTHEIALSLGLGHGTFFQARTEWLAPAMTWARSGR